MSKLESSQAFSDDTRMCIESETDCCSDDEEEKGTLSENKQKNKHVSKFSLICEAVRDGKECHDSNHDHSVADKWFRSFQSPMTLEQLKAKYPTAKYRKNIIWDVIEQINGHWKYIGPMRIDGTLPRVRFNLHGKRNKNKLTALILLMQHDAVTMKRFIDRELFVVSFCEEENCVYHSLFITEQSLVQQDFQKYFTDSDRWNVTYRILQNAFYHKQHHCLLYNKVTERGCTEAFPFYGCTKTVSRIMLIIKSGRWLDSKEYTCHSHPDRRNCINPLHFRIGTAQENMDDRSMHATLLGKRKHHDEVQTKIYELKNSYPSKPWKKIAEEIGLDYKTCRNLFHHKKRRMEDIHFKSSRLADIDLTSDETKREIQKRLDKVCTTFQDDEKMCTRFQKQLQKNNDMVRFSTYKTYL